MIAARTTLLLALLAPLAGAKEITLPPETAALSPSSDLGYAYASGFCGTCHSADYIQHQPPAMPRAFWQAEVLKMRKTYGCPIPDVVVDPIAEYLTRTYGSGQPPVDKTK